MLYPLDPCLKTLSATDPDPPLDSLEGERPSLRAWTVDELGTASRGAPPLTFPAALPDGHPAVACFRKFGYVVILDALAPEALARAGAVFRSKQAAARQIQRAGAHTRARRPGHAPDSPAERYFDLPREGLGC